MRCKRLQGKAFGPKIRTSEDPTIYIYIYMSWHIYCYTDTTNFIIFSQLLRYQFLINRNKIIKYENMTNHNWK